jgi:hypothetical protein
MTTTQAKFLADARKHITDLKKRKPSRTMLPMMLHILDGILIMFQQREELAGSSNLLKALEVMRKKVKKEKQRGR